MHSCGMCYNIHLMDTKMIRILFWKLRYILNGGFKIETYLRKSIDIEEIPAAIEGIGAA